MTDHAIQEIAKEVKNRRENIYLLLEPIVPNSLLSTKYYLTNQKNASNWIKKGGSIWTFYKTNTKVAINRAGYKAGGMNYELKHYVENMTEWHASSLGLPTLDHMHTLSKENSKVRVNNSVHAFFGLPHY